MVEESALPLGVTLSGKVSKGLVEVWLVAFVVFDCGGQGFHCDCTILGCALQLPGKGVVSDGDAVFVVENVLAFVLLHHVPAGPFVRIGKVSSHCE